MSKMCYKVKEKKGVFVMEYYMWYCLLLSFLLRGILEPVTLKTTLVKECLFFSSGVFELPQPHFIVVFSYGGICSEECH